MRTKQAPERYIYENISNTRDQEPIQQPASPPQFVNTNTAEATINLYSGEPEIEQNTASNDQDGTSNNSQAICEHVDVAEASHYHGDEFELHTTPQGSENKHKRRINFKHYNRSANKKAKVCSS